MVNFKKKFRCKLTLMETMRRNTVAEDIELDRIQVKFVIFYRRIDSVNFFVVFLVSYFDE